MRRLLGTAWHPDAAATFLDVCADARRRRGLRGAAFTVIAELADLLRSAVRARLGSRVPITSGRRPSPPHNPGRFPMQTLVHDLKLAFRSLMASRVPATIAIVTLALGIGVGTAIFSVLDSMIFRPVPFQHADRLVELWNFNTTSKFSYPRFARPLLLEWHKQTDLFDRFEAYESESAIHSTAKGAEMVDASYVTPGLLPMLGVAPLRGRLFAEGDGRDGTDQLVVISERFWRGELQQDPHVIGRRLNLNGRDHEIVGIMPASFYFPSHPQELWLPLDPAQPPARRMKGPFSMVAFARIRADVTLDQVHEQVQVRGADLVAAAGGRAGVTAKLNFKGDFDPRTRQSLWVLGGAVAFLLLIVCANIANLSLSRALSRSRDMAVRASLGASRGDLIRETFVENLLIGGTGAVLGLGVAWVTLSVGVPALPEQIMFSTINPIDLDLRVVSFGMVAGMVAAVLFGLPPALIASRPDVNAVLRQDSRVSSGNAGSRRLRGGLVIAEVTIAIVLLAGAALMGRSLYKLQAIDRGFNTEGLIALRVGLPAQGYLDPYARDLFTDELIARLRQIPGVSATSAGGVPPDSSIISFGKFEFAHAPGTTTDAEQVVPIYTVWPGYFEAIGLAIKDGRAFDTSDTPDKVIISEAFARDHWPNQSAVGGQFRFAGGKAWKTVVGVVTDVRQLDLDDSSGAYEWFQPMRTPPGRVAPAITESTAALVDYRTFAVRAENPADVIPALSDVVHALDSRVVIWETKLVDDLYAESVARPRVVLVVLAIFAALGLTLAAAGLYGVLSYLVSQRLREIGIRLALGAAPSGVFTLVLKHGLALTAIGLVLGLAAAQWLTRLIRALLFEVDAFDPLAMAAVALLLLLTALLACWRPARRAMRVDPVHLLRES